MSYLKGAEGLVGLYYILPEGSLRSSRLITYLKGAEGLIGLYYNLSEGS